jgi:8-oxo-dGTP pyrophosphatase MutT (NUDIX family)
MQHQVAALPIRRAKNGALEVLLITSRETGRWIIPKGWSCKRLKDHEAAAREAEEEAGVAGKVRREAIGSYRYTKRELGDEVSIAVSVFLLDVLKERRRWPEKRQRQRAWFEISAAAKVLEEPALSALVEVLHAAIPADPLPAKKKPAVRRKPALALVKI